LFCMLKTILNSNKNILNNRSAKIYLGMIFGFVESVLLKSRRPTIKLYPNLFVKVTGSNNNVFLIVCDKLSGNIVYGTSLYTNNFKKNKKLYNYFVEKFGKYFSWRLQDVKFSGFSWKYYFHRLPVKYIDYFVPVLGRYSEDQYDLSCSLSIRVAFNGVKQSKRGKLYNKFL
jgi:hypothetical protein